MKIQVTFDLTKAKNFGVDGIGAVVSGKIGKKAINMSQVGNSEDTIILKAIPDFVRDDLRIIKEIDSVLKADIV